MCDSNETAAASTCTEHALSTMCRSSAHGARAARVCSCCACALLAILRTLNTTTPNIRHAPGVEDRTYALPTAVYPATRPAAWGLWFHPRCLESVSSRGLPLAPHTCRPHHKQLTLTRVPQSSSFSLAPAVSSSGLTQLSHSLDCTTFARRGVCGEATALWARATPKAARGDGQEGGVQFLCAPQVAELRQERFGVLFVPDVQPRKAGAATADATSSSTSGGITQAIAARVRGQLTQRVRSWVDSTLRLQAALHAAGLVGRRIFDGSRRSCGGACIVDGACRHRPLCPRKLGVVRANHRAAAVSGSLEAVNRQVGDRRGGGEA
eukprot:5311204-Prymnesium_polylepis.2